MTTTTKRKNKVETYSTYSTYSTLSTNSTYSTNYTNIQHNKGGVEESRFYIIKVLTIV